ncbi:MAG: hypothetical protein DME21_05285 [Verrucomicrobia bacterium]|nr:MAG: hypothetical protein DME21_05285 [Verrucomicrobiota bacterium]
MGDWHPPQFSSSSFNTPLNFKQGGGPQSLECIITNCGRAATKCAEVRCNQGLPVGTEVFNAQ